MSELGSLGFQCIGAPPGSCGQRNGHLQYRVWSSCFWVFSTDSSTHLDVRLNQCLSHSYGVLCSVFHIIFRTPLTGVDGTPANVPHSHWVYVASILPHFTAFCLWLRRRPVIERKKKNIYFAFYHTNVNKKKKETHFTKRLYRLFVGQLLLIFQSSS